MVHERLCTKIEDLDTGYCVTQKQRNGAVKKYFFSNTVTLPYTHGGRRYVQCLALG